MFLFSELQFYITKDDLTEIYKITNASTIAVFASIFLVLFFIGFSFRANDVYKKACNELSDDYASNAWYPIINIMPMSKVAGCSYIIPLITSILFVVSVPLCSVLLILKMITTKACTVIILSLYLLYSLCHTFVLKKYMNKFYPETSDISIVASGFIPFLKYYIHVIK